MGALIGNEVELAEEEGNGGRDDAAGVTLEKGLGCGGH